MQFKNDSLDYAELFSVGSEIFESDATVPVSAQQDTIFNLDEDNMVIDD